MTGRRLATEEAPSPVAVKKKEPVRVAAPVVADADWSSSSESEEEPQEAKPDMEKVHKFVEKLKSYVNENESKKIESIVKKIPVNFGTPELTSLEPMRAVLSLVLTKEITEADEETVTTQLRLVAPVLMCLEEHYPSVSEFQSHLLEHVQVFANNIGLPRLSPETALIEQLWIALYESQIVAEESFQLWLDNDAFDSPGKQNTLFQTEAFRAWLYGLELPGVEATMKRGSKAAEEEEKDEWSDSDSDIEALVPKRISTAGINLRPTGVAPLRR
jgi:hypothetical protein